HPKDNSINFFPLTAVGAGHTYGLDLVSGKRFRKHRLYRQRDIWEKYPLVVERPPYTEGLVPRLLDPAGLPQKILVFGRPKFYQELDLNSGRSFRVRVVGGLVEQYCSKYPCTGQQE